MKIAWVLYGDLDQRTGGTIYDAEIVAGLRRAGEDVRVVPPSLAQLSAMDPDVIVGDELCFRELAWIFRRTRARKVLLVHHWTAWEEERSTVERGVARVWERAAMRAANLVIATSETTRMRLRRGENARGRIEVVRPGADRLKARPHVGGDGLLFLGSVTARKRVLPLVQACTTRLTVVGSLDREPAYVAQVRAAAGAHVVLRGELSDDEVADALARADALVMPSSLEGYGIAATEALWAGVPVLAARAPGLEEALSGFPDACVLFDDVAAALRAFPAQRDSLRTAAASARERLPTWSESVTCFRAVLEK